MTPRRPRTAAALKLRALILAAIASLWTCPTLSQTAPPPQGLLGMSLPTAEKRDFFTFFRLLEVRRERDSVNRSVAVFRPGAPAFHDLVAVRTTLDSQDGIVQIELALARSFIDNSGQRVFANDIATSMLRSTPSRADLPALTPLIQEIAGRSVPGLETHFLHEPPPEMPAQESPGYATYNGERSTYSQRLTGSALHMENLQKDGEDWLLIRVSRKP